MEHNKSPKQPTLFDWHADDDLFEMLCSIGFLKEGFRAVKKNGGRPGIDGRTIEDFEANLAGELKQLREELRSWTYSPKPVRRVEISKPDGGIRLLGVPTVRNNCT
jgi:RNA-directed DNA polymerase